MEYITYQSIMRIAETDPNLRKTFQGVVHQVYCAGGGAAVGGLVGGPFGAVIGTLVGMAVGYFTVKDYKSLIVVLQNMSDADRRRFVAEVQQLIGSSTQDVLLAFVRSEANRKKLLDIFQKFC